jgi:hypothetical protein
MKPVLMINKKNMDMYQFAIDKFKKELGEDAVDQDFLDNLDSVIISYGLKQIIKKYDLKEI